MYRRAPGSSHSQQGQQSAAFSYGPSSSRLRQPVQRLSNLAPVASAAVPPTAVDPAWREKAQPIKSGSNYPAKEFCSNCGLCDTHYVAHVKQACAFLGDGMSKIETMEQQVHGRSRNLANDDELRFGVVQEVRAHAFPAALVSAVNTCNKG